MSYVNQPIEHVQALQSAMLDIGVFDMDNDSMRIRKTSVDGFARLLPWLRWANSNGLHIYVRPSGEHQMTLVDDLTADGVVQMQAEGFEPSFLVETSPDNFQAWLNNGQVLGHEVSTRVAQLIAARFGGDPSSADWRHFGRLAGFTNRKPKYRNEKGQYPFVKAHAVGDPGGSYSEARATIDQARAELAEDAAQMARERQAWQTRMAAMNANQRASLILPIHRFWEDARYGGDLNRADLAWAVHALARGAAPAVVEQGLLSRDLAHKGNEQRQRGYATRTVKKALAHLS